MRRICLYYTRSMFDGGAPGTMLNGRDLMLNLSKKNAPVQKDTCTMKLII